MSATLSVAFTLTGLTAQAAKTPSLADLLRDRSVTIVRAGSLFMPGVEGRGPQLVSGDKHAIAYRRGKLIGLVEVGADAMPKGARAKVLDYRSKHPGSFATPGFVDADSRWFRNTSDISDRRPNPTAKAGEALELWQQGWGELVSDGGITSLFIPASVASQSSGAGTLVSVAGTAPRPVADGALAWRMSSPQTRGTNLTRSSVTKSLATSFDAARKYDEAKDKYKKALEDFAKKRKEFLAYYKKNPLKQGEEIKAAPPKPTRSRRRGLPRNKEELEAFLKRVPPAMRDRIRKQIEARMKAAADAAKKASAATAKKPSKPAATKKPTSSKKAPPRPKRPKKPKVEPVKEAMLAVLAGKSVLRVEVHRAAEIRALLRIAKEEGIERLVIVGGTEAWKVAEDLRVAGASVVLRPETIPGGFDTLPDQIAASAAKLAAEGVPVAFGSAGRERGRMLPLMAARAVSQGMEESSAMQALTQGGIEASGLSKSVDTGIVVWSGNPLAITSRPLEIVQGRRTRSLARRTGDK